MTLNCRYGDMYVRSMYLDLKLDLLKAVFNKVLLVFGRSYIYIEFKVLEGLLPVQTEDFGP